jgi:YHS domain-containing protein
MSGRKIVLAMTIAMIGFGLTCLVSCKKKEQPAPKPAEAPTMEEMQKHAEEMKKTATATVEEAKKTAETIAASMEQTICPVTGNKIDKNVFIEYKGKKVYFCCKDCKAVFEKDPEKYIAKLPQFAK